MKIFVMYVDEHLHKLQIVYEFYVCCSTDHFIQLPKILENSLFCYHKIDIVAIELTAPRQ